MYKKFIAAFKESLSNGLSQKTNWGRNEVLALIDKAMIEALLKVCDESQ